MRGCVGHLLIKSAISQGFDQIHVTLWIAAMDLVKLNKQTLNIFFLFVFPKFFVLLTLKNEFTL